MRSLRQSLACAAAAAMCLVWSAPAEGQRRGPTKGRRPAPGRAASVKIPPGPAAGGGSSEKTREEADALLEAGERYVDPDFVPPAGVEAEASSAAAAALEEADRIFDSGNYTEGMAAYRRVVGKYPRNAEAQLALGEAYNAMGEYGSAFAPFVQALRLGSGGAAAQYGIGHAYVNVDKPKEALPFLRAAIRLDPGFAEARYDLGLAYAALGNKKAALAEYQALTGLDSDLAEKLNQAISQ